MRKLLKLFFDNAHWPILLAIILLGIWLRSINWNPEVILDYDPWWFFRHAQEILNNGFLPPQWDILSYYPPGRPVDYYLGWSYTLAIVYAAVSKFMTISFTNFAGIFVAIFAGLCAIPAYFVGKHVTNRWGGLATAFFSVITIVFLSVSIAGYPDSDATNVFYTFLAILGTLYAVKKADMVSFESRDRMVRSIAKFAPYAMPAVLAYWLFAINWSSSWYIYYMFVVFIPMLVVFRIAESMIKREHKFGIPMFVAKVRENRGLIFAIIFIGLAGELLSVATSGWPFNTIPPHDQLIQGLNIIGTKSVALVGFIAMFGMIGAISGLAFGRLPATVVGGLIGVALSIVLVLSGVTGQSLIVNQSVAELQAINDIFGQFSTIIGRIGGVPLFFAFCAFAITGLKLVFKKEIHTAEYFAIIWFIISLFLITKGIRFSLLLSMATATAAGFTVGNLIMFAKRRGSPVMLGAFFAVFIMAAVIHFNDNYGFSRAAGGGLDISQNFRDGFDWLKENSDQNTIISTWWDPGHIIAGSTGLKVMADGAHCGPSSCAFLDHNSRIQDMGRSFAVSSEEESAKILSKYMSITPEQCQELKQRFGSKVPAEACDPLDKMYVLATSDLIGKYYWLSFFGTGQGAVYTQCGFHQQETQRLGAPTYVCGAAVPMEISLIQQGNSVFAIMNSPQQGVRNAPVRDLVFYQNGQQAAIRASNATNIVDGMAWVDPSFGTLIFMQPHVRDSVFTNMYFFNGNGLPEMGIEPLKRFRLAYQNPEMKVYEVDFTGII